MATEQDCILDCDQHLDNLHEFLTSESILTYVKQTPTLKKHIDDIVSQRISSFNLMSLNNTYTKQQIDANLNVFRNRLSNYN